MRGIIVAFNRCINSLGICGIGPSRDGCRKWHLDLRSFLLFLRALLHAISPALFPVQTPAPSFSLCLQFSHQSGNHIAQRCSFEEKVFDTIFHPSHRCTAVPVYHVISAPDTPPTSHSAWIVAVPWLRPAEEFGSKFPLDLYVSPK